MFITCSQFIIIFKWESQKCETPSFNNILSWRLKQRLWCWLLRCFKLLPLGGSIAPDWNSFSDPGRTSFWTKEKNMQCLSQCFLADGLCWIIYCLRGLQIIADICASLFYPHAFACVVCPTSSQRCGSSGPLKMSPESSRLRTISSKASSTSTTCGHVSCLQHHCLHSLILDMP